MPQNFNFAFPSGDEFQKFQRGLQSPRFGEDVTGVVAPRVRAGILPPGTTQQLGESLRGLINFQPEKVQIRRAQPLPAEFYQRQLEQLTAPGIRQFVEHTRPQAVGTLAAEGTLRDYEGGERLFDLDKEMLEQIGRITQGVQLAREERESGIEQGALQREESEDAARRAMQFQALTGGAGLAGELALGQAGLDAQTLAALGQISGQQFGREADLFGALSRLGTERELGLGELELGRSKLDAERELQRRRMLFDIATAPGFQDFPQLQGLASLSTELGFTPQIGASERARIEARQRQIAQELFSRPLPEQRAPLLAEMDQLARSLGRFGIG